MRESRWKAPGGCRCQEFSTSSTELPRPAATLVRKNHRGATETDSLIAAVAFRVFRESSEHAHEMNPVEKKHRDVSEARRERERGADGFSIVEIRGKKGASAGSELSAEFFARKMAEGCFEGARNLASLNTIGKFLSKYLIVTFHGSRIFMNL